MLQNLRILDQDFSAHPYGVLFWKEKKILLIADVHLGKVAHFRKHGSAVPKEAIYENFQRLNEVLTYFKPKEVLILGDLFHSYLNEEWNLFCTWINEQNFKFTLVAGNHDIIPKSYFEDLCIEVFEEKIIDDFYFTHYPEEREGYYNFCGHVHPVIELEGFGRQRLKPPCFFQQKHQLILPAFGVFTGGFAVQPVAGDKVYALSNDEVVPVQLT